MKNRTYKYFEGGSLYAFGHGLSYTTFDYKNAKLASSQIPADGTAVSFTIENTGRLDGDDVVQIYFRHVNPSVPQPTQACVVCSVHVKKGQAKQVTIDVPARHALTGIQNKNSTWSSRESMNCLSAASDDIRLELPFKIVSSGRSGSVDENLSVETIWLSSLDVSRVEQGGGVRHVQTALWITGV